MAETTQETNWWGEISHPSDQLVHWSRTKNTDEARREIAELRTAWDLIHADPKIAAAAKVLIHWTIELEGSNASEAAAGADL
jgi:hypothetical protein